MTVSGDDAEPTTGCSDDRISDVVLALPGEAPVLTHVAAAALLDILLTAHAAAENAFSTVHRCYPQKHRESA